MKKLIGTVSIAMMLGCALALANTDDASNTTSNSHGTSTTDTMNTDQQAGTSGDVNNANPNVTTDQTTPENKMDSSSSTTTTTTKSAKSAMNKSCVDDSGKTLQKGQTGYRACIKAHKKDQMGGIANEGTDVNTDTK